MTAARVLREAQVKWLLRFDVHGRLSFTLMSGFMKANLGKMMQRLEAIGYVRPYPHGGFELTEQGATFVKAERARINAPGAR